jgi:hypothetical protein
MWPYFGNLLRAGNIGIMVFFTVTVAPTIFTALPPQWSAAYVREFFPKYCLFLGVSTVVASAMGFDAGMGLVRQSLHWLSVRFNMVQLLVFTWLFVPTERAP